MTNASVKWILVGLLFSSIITTPKTAMARCCCNHDLWTRYSHRWEWEYDKSVRKSNLRYHYPTWKFDQTTHEWRRISQ